MPSEAPTAGPYDARRKLHPATVLFAALDAARAFFVPALLAAFGIGGGTGTTGLWLVVLVAVPSVLSAAGKYLTFRYRLAPDELIIDSGVIARRHRVIPLRRLQNIDVKQTAVERLVGVAELRVETASGGRETEAVLNVLAADDAEALRSELIARRHRLTAARDADVDAASPADAERHAAPGVPLVRLAPRDLVIAGATANEAGLLAAGLASLLELVGELPIQLPEPDVDPSALTTGRALMLAAAAVLALILLFVVVGWFVSIAGTLVRYWGFGLERAGDELRKEYGLLARHTGSVPLERVQAVRLEESLLRRAFGLAALKIETAGLRLGRGAGGRRGGAEAFVPITRTAAAPELVAAVLPEARGVRLAGLERVHPRARRRAAVRYSLPILLGAAGLAALVDAGWLLLLGLLPLAWLLAEAHYRSLGWARRPGLLLARAGVLTRVTWIVPLRKLQTLHVRATPFQRRHGLATLIADTAAGGADVARVIDLDRAVAARLLRELNDEARAIRAYAGSSLASRSSTASTSSEVLR